jgi:hypothetical protein
MTLELVRGARPQAPGLKGTMVAFVLGLTLAAALALARNLLVAGGWPAGLGLLAGVVSFGADPADPGRATMIASVSFVVATLVRRA